MSPRLARDLARLRRRFLGYQQNTVGWLQKRRELAPEFGRLWLRFHHEQPPGENTFPHFVRLLDPALPQPKKLYKAHPSWNAAVYLRQLALPTRKYARERIKAQMPLRVLLLRVLHTWASYMGEEPVWAMVAAISKWDAPRIARLKKDAQKAKSVPLTFTPKQRPAKPEKKAA